MPLLTLIEVDIDFMIQGIIYDKAGRDQDALADYDKAIELNPHNADAYNIRGRY